jgi:nucleoside-diphosphate-sugar epimerase
LPGCAPTHRSDRGDLDDERSLDRLRTAPFGVLHFAPPPSEGREDPRTQHLVAALSKARIIPQRFVYVSTTGVYGTAPARACPRRARSARRRRAHAVASRRKQRCACGPHATRVALAILRVPGIYADTRLPLDRIRAGTPALLPEDDVYTNHVHADDLARAVIAALFRGKPNRAYNVGGRCRAQDGRVVRRRCRCVPAAAPAAHRLGGGRAAHGAAAAVVHERIAAPVQSPHEARA